VSKFHDLPEFYEDPDTMGAPGKERLYNVRAPKITGGEEVVTRVYIEELLFSSYTLVIILSPSCLQAYVAFMEELNMFRLGLQAVIANTWIGRYQEFRNEKMMVVTLSGSGLDVVVLAVGLVVQDIEDINYIDGSFTVDLDVYLSKVTYGEPYNGLASAMRSVWTNLNESHVAEIDEDGVAHQKILENDFLYLKDPLKEGETLIKDGRCNTPAMKSTRPLTSDEYKVSTKLRDGLLLIFLSCCFAL